MNGVEWVRSWHKQRRYDLMVSTCGQYYRKSTEKPKLHGALEREIKCLDAAKSMGLTKIQKIVDGVVDRSGTSYVITEHCGKNLTRSRVPLDWRQQLDIIDEELMLLQVEHSIYHNDVQMRNLFVDGSALTLLDFDLASFKDPNRRAMLRPEFLCCDRIRDKIINKWGVR